MSKTSQLGIGQWYVTRWSASSTHFLKSAIWLTRFGSESQTSRQQGAQREPQYGDVLHSCFEGYTQNTLCMIPSLWYTIHPHRMHHQGIHITVTGPHRGYLGYNKKNQFIHFKRVIFIEWELGKLWDYANNLFRTTSPQKTFRGSSTWIQMSRFYLLLA